MEGIAIIGIIPSLRFDTGKLVLDWILYCVLPTVRIIVSEAPFNIGVIVSVSPTLIVVLLRLIVKLTSPSPSTLSPSALAPSKTLLIVLVELTDDLTDECVIVLSLVKDLPPPDESGSQSFTEQFVLLISDMLIELVSSPPVVVSDTIFDWSIETVSVTVLVILSSLSISAA